MLKHFFGTIKPIEYKNNGGCLFFCYVFWKYLKKHNLPYNTYQIVQYELGDSNTKRNIQFINGEVDTADSSRHFTWLYEGKEYDGNGETKAGNSAYGTDGNRTVLNGLQNDYENLVDKFCVNALTHGDWNSMFNRKQAIKRIEKTLELELGL